MKKHVLNAALAFMLVFTFGLLNAQTGTTIQGTVKDNKGEAVIGAAIIVKGTTVGTISDADGKFSLTLPAGAETLIIKYIGYKAKEVQIALGKFDVALEEDNKELDDVVVTALGVKRERKALGYSTQQISGADVSEAKDANIVNDLEGKIAGVQVTGNGNIGGSSRIVIRGIKSLTGENQPLFVVDGIVIDNSNFTNANLASGDGIGIDYGNAASDINADDIESVNVLKGGPAAALYGSRGANGVIVITTKRGSKHEKGKYKSPIGVTIGEDFMVNQVSVLPKYQNQYGAGYGPTYNADETDPTQTRLRMQDDGSWGPAIDGRLVRQYPSYDPSDPLYGKSTPYITHPDNVKDFFRTGYSANTNVSMDGANDNGSFRMAFSNFDQQGTVPNSSLKRNNITFAGTYNFTDKLFADVNATYVHNEGVGRPAVGYNSIFSNFTQWWERQLDIKDLKNYINPDGTQRTWNLIANGNTNPDGSAAYSPYFWNNPYWQAYQNYENDHRDRFYGSADVGYKIFPWLTAQVKVTTDRYNEYREERVSIGSSIAGGPGVGIPQYSVEQIAVSENNYEGRLTAQHSFKHDFDILAIFGINRRDNHSTDNYTSTQSGLNVPDWYTLANSVGNLEVADVITQKRVNSVFGNASIGWKRMLFLDITLRNDWSSSLYSATNGNSSHVSYFYPSVGGSFVFSELLKNNKILSLGKIRGSWADVGNDTHPYATSTLQQASQSFGTLPQYYVPSTFNDPSLKPENIYTWEVGTELALFVDRINIDATYYQSLTKNNIFAVEQSGSTGINYRFTNAGDLSDKGFELATNFLLVKEKGFKWSVGFNFAKNVNTVKDLYKDASGNAVTSLTLGQDGFGRASIEAIAGQAYGQIVGYDYVYDGHGNKIVGPDGNYLSTSTVQPLGSIQPNVTGGVSTTMSYKGFTLFALFDFQQGGHIFSETNMWGEYDGTLEITAANNIRVNGLVVPGVQQAFDGSGNAKLDAKGNPTSNGQKNTTVISAINYYQNGTGNGFYGPTAANVYDASFVKLRELKLIYALPAKLFAKTPIRGISIGLIGRNLAILKKNVPNIDPESATNTGNVQGIEGGAKPTERSIGFNFSVKF